MSWYLEIHIGKHCIRRLHLDLSEVTIGRSEACPIHLPAEVVSRRHARLWVSSQIVTLEDIGSTNGLYMNGSCVSRCILKDGDRFSIGPYLFTLRNATGSNDFPRVSAAILHEDALYEKTVQIDPEVVKKIHEQSNSLDETQNEKVSPIRPAEPVKSAQPESQDLSLKFGKLR